MLRRTRECFLKRVFIEYVSKSLHFFPENSSFLRGVGPDAGVWVLLCVCLLEQKKGNKTLRDYTLKKIANFFGDVLTHACFSSCDRSRDRLRVGRARKAGAVPTRPRRPPRRPRPSPAPWPACCPWTWRNASSTSGSWTSSGARTARCSRTPSWRPTPTPAPTPPRAAARGRRHPHPKRSS